MRLVTPAVSTLRPSLAARTLLLLKERSLIEASHLSDVAIPVVAAPLVAIAAKAGAGQVPLASRRRHIFSRLIREAEIATTMGVATSRLFSLGPLLRQGPPQLLEVVRPLVLVAGVARADQGLFTSATFCAPLCETTREVVAVSPAA